MTADFPRRQQRRQRGKLPSLLSGQLPGAATRRGEAETRLWLSAGLLELDWRVFHGAAWGLDQWAGAKALALVGALLVEPNPLLPLPAIWGESPAMEGVPHTALRWLLWHPGRAGCLELSWNPNEEFIFSVCGLTVKRSKAESIRLFELVRVPERPGPKPGTGAVYSSRDEWHQAIRDKVLVRSDRESADDSRLARWLRVSETLLYNLMRNWGPKKLADLRSGNFDPCDCRSCRAN